MVHVHRHGHPEKVQVAFRVGVEAELNGFGRVALISVGEAGPAAVSPEVGGVEGEFLSQIQHKGGNGSADRKPVSGKSEGAGHPGVAARAAKLMIPTGRNQIAGVGLGVEATSVNDMNGREKLVGASQGHVDRIDDRIRAQCYQAEE